MKNRTGSVVQGSEAVAGSCEFVRLFTEAKAQEVFAASLPEES